MSSTMNKVRLCDLDVADNSRARNALIKHKVDLEFDLRDEPNPNAQEAITQEIDRTEESIAAFRYYSKRAEISEQHANLIISTLRLEAENMNKLAGFISEQVAHTRSLNNGWDAE